MRGYGDYRFRNKNPAIDILRGGIQLVAVSRNVPFHVIRDEIADELRMHRRTMYDWFSGPTEIPYHHSIESVARWSLKRIHARDFGWKDNVVDLANEIKRRREPRTRKAAA